jgi:hypothetical protein
MKALLIAWMAITAAIPLVAGALNRLSDPLGGHATSHELGNIRPRQEGCGAAVVLSVGLPRHGLPVELSWCVGWGPRVVAPFFIDQSFRNRSAEQPDGALAYRNKSLSQNRIA